jgi:hypothetical protein
VGLTPLYIEDIMDFEKSIQQYHKEYHRNILSSRQSAVKQQWLSYTIKCNHIKSLLQNTEGNKIHHINLHYLEKELIFYQLQAKITMNALLKLNEPDLI